MLPEQQPEATGSLLHPPTLSSPATTRQLPELSPAPVTRSPPSVPPEQPEPLTRRMPVVIRGEMKKPLLPPVPVRKKQRLYVRLAGLLLLTLVIGLTLISVTPLGRDFGQNFKGLESGNGMVKNLDNGPSNLVAQATATAVFHYQNDGFDPYYSNSQILSNGSASLAWPAGECTYWANYKYHQLTGYWIPWSGNADQWVAGARQAGWVVSKTPRVPSIIVLMPHVQLASAFGHVAVVVKIINRTTVLTSNMNWYANGGGFGRVSYVTFTVGPGVYFIWHP